MADSPFLAVAIQYRADPTDYATREAFLEAMRLRMERARIGFPPDLPTLVVFPEDIGLGLALTADFPALRGCKTLMDAGHVLLERYAGAVQTEQGRGGASAFSALLRVLSKAHVERAYRETFSTLAGEHGVYLCAGSAPLALDEATGGVYNVSYLFGPDGALLGAQRKSHLVEMESRALGLEAGSEAELGVIALPFATVGIAICYDAFHPGVVQALAGQGATVLLQPSFNPQPWTPEQAAEWETGLWHALQTTPGLRAGINPMMVGGLFDVVGEGRSSIVAPRDRTPDGSGYLARAASVDAEEVVSAIIG